MQNITILTQNLHNAAEITNKVVSYSQNNVLGICAVCFAVAAIGGFCLKKLA